MGCKAPPGLSTTSFAILLLVLSVAAPSFAVTPAGTSQARADALLERQGSLLLEGKKEEALEGIDETLALYREAGDVHGRAAALVLRGMARWGERGGGPTVSDLEAGLALLEEAGDPMGSWLVLWLLGEAERQEGRFDAAEAHLRRALDLLTELKSSREPLDFRGFEKLGRVCGAPVEMLQAMGPASAFVKPILVGFLEIPVRDTLVGVLIEQEELDEAEGELEAAFAGSPLFGGLFDGQLLLRRGDLRRRQWRLDEARESYRKALEAPTLAGLVPAGQGGVLAWRALDRLAEIESLSGRFEEALAWNDRALEQGREMEDRSREAMVLQDRSELHARRNDYEQARRLLLQAEEIAREIGDEYRLAVVLGDLGTYALMTGSYGTAASCLERSVALLEKIEEPYLAAPTLLLLVEVYQMLEAHEGTDGLLERATELADASEFHQAASMAELLAVWSRFQRGEAERSEVRRGLGAFLEAAGDLVAREGPWLESMMVGLDAVGLAPADLTEEAARKRLEGEMPPLGEALARVSLGAVLLGKDSLEAAELEFRQAARKFEQAGHRDMEAMVLGALAALRWKDGDRDRAIEVLEGALETFETVLDDVPVEELLAGLLGSRGFYYDLGVNFLVAAERPREAFVQAERARARAFLRLLGNQRLRPVAGGDPELIARADALRDQIGRWEEALFTAPPAAVARLESDLDHARREYQGLMVRLKVQSPEYTSLTSIDPISAEEVQAALAPGTTLISYFTTARGSFAWMIDRQRLEMVPLDLGPSDLEEIGCWVRQVGRARAAAEEGLARPRGVTLMDGCEPVGDLAEHLYGELVAPLPPLRRGSKLVIVPHGPLHYLPFAALRDPESGRYLIEDHEITLAPSASVVPLLRAKESAVEGRALVLGAPAIDDPRLPELRGALEEAKEVASHFGVEPLLGPAATEDAIHSVADDVDLLHVSAHGVYLPEAPRFTRIALAGGEEHDGNLEVHEVFGEVDLSGVNLVVLSACQTAVGPDAGGDEIVSLTRAFLYAGTPGVISTLWQVEDRASAELMKGFYRRLLEGERAATALRATQLEMIGSGYRDPYYWAGYTLTGDPLGRWGRGGVEDGQSSDSTSSANLDSPSAPSDLPVESSRP